MGCEIHCLQLIRKDDNDAMFRTAAVGAGKVVLSKLAWLLRIVQSNDVLKVDLYKSTTPSLLGCGCVNVRSPLYLKQNPASGYLALALHRKIHDGY